MRSRTRSIAALAAVIVAAGAGVAVSGGSAYAAQSTETVKCGGEKLVVRVPINKSPSGGWGAAHIVSGGTGHLNPIRFTGSLHDDTVNVTLFSFDQVKAGGKANHNQQTITCTQSETGTLGDSLEPGETPPPGTSATDKVTFNLEVTAVPHP
jgi:hypothetical protein